MVRETKPVDARASRRQQQADTPYRSLGNDALGGHRARQGFRFQDLWLSFQLLDWVTQRDFRGAVNEGADDVDASWFAGEGLNGKTSRSKQRFEIHQLKDTSITPKLLSEVLDAFSRKDDAFPSTWSRYHLVATRCADKVHGLPATLRQTRNYLFTYGRDSRFAQVAISEFGDKLVSLDVKIDPAFVVDRVELDFDAGWVRQAEVFNKQLYLRIAGHGVPPDKVEKAAQALIALVSGEKVGALILREAVLELLEEFKPAAVPTKQVPLTQSEPMPAIVSRSPSGSTGDEPMLISILAGGGALLRLPGDRYGLIDCNMTAAKQAIAYIEAFKVESFEFIAVTHWDADRFSGLLTVMSGVKQTQAVVLPAHAFVGPYGARFLSEIEGERGRSYGIGRLVHTNARSTIWSDGNAKVETFAADMYDPETLRGARGGDVPLGRALYKRNDLCSVFRVSVADHHFLITGDASIRRWTHLFSRLLQSDEPFLADGFTLPHHGSKNALNKDILGRITTPSGFYAVVDPFPIFNLPRSDILKLVRDSNGEILVADTIPVHLLLTSDGLFERRFALGRVGDMRVILPPGGRMRRF